MKKRPSGRAADELRPIRITRRFTRHAEGSVLIEFGETRVLCTASIEDGVPPFLRNKGSGWITAELWSGHEESELLRIPYRPLRIVVVAMLTGLLVVNARNALRGLRR